MNGALEFFWVACQSQECWLR